MAVLTLVPESIGGRPVAPTRGALRPLGPAEVRITGGSWSARQAIFGANQHVRQSGPTPRIRCACLNASGGGTADGVAIVLCDHVGQACRRWAHG